MKKDPLRQGVTPASPGPSRAAMTMSTDLNERPPQVAQDCIMGKLEDQASRTDLLNRLKRAEGQLRGIQRMIEGGESCLDIASQMSAVRKALDSAYVRMTVCFMQQELQQRLGADVVGTDTLTDMFDDMQTLLGKVR
jgi:DNA-binding FrmR family transcriptional regulator